MWPLTFVCPASCFSLILLLVNRTSSFSTSLTHYAAFFSFPQHLAKQWAFPIFVCEVCLPLWPQAGTSYVSYLWLKSILWKIVTWPCVLNSREEKKWQFVMSQSYLERDCWLPPMDEAPKIQTKIIRVSSNSRGYFWLALLEEELPGCFFFFFFFACLYPLSLYCGYFHSQKHFLKHIPVSYMY